MTKKKLIEVALPLEKINEESAREKSIRHGHPSTLHLWWARRPLAAARAVIWSSLVDDPSSHPELFPSEKDQALERKRLFKILEDLVVWENSNDEQVIRTAQEEILKWTDNNPPSLLDPFAGGGAIPLEAQRLGLEAYAQDLNPVAVLINKAMIEIPSRFANMPPVNQLYEKGFAEYNYKGAEGLAEDVRYYGERLKELAFSRIGHCYPKAKSSQKSSNQELSVVAWIWCRTVKCPNPVCKSELPLSSSFYLSKKERKCVWIEPQTSNGKLSFKLHHDGKPVIESTVSRKGAVCPFCGTPVSFEYIRAEAKNGRMSSRLAALVLDGANGKSYSEASIDQEMAADVMVPSDIPEIELPKQALGFRVQNYGIEKYKDLFTKRQLLALATFSQLVKDVAEMIEKDALQAGLADDHVPLEKGGKGAMAYSQAISIYLAFVNDKIADIGSTLSTWINTIEAVRNTFARQTLSMKWDYAEANPFSNSTGCYANMLNWVVKCLKELPASKEGVSRQLPAQQASQLSNVMISTDPPYYDNIGYADLSDFFYMWLRQSIREVYPSLFSTLTVPKIEELIATPFRFDGDMDAAKEFFEKGMVDACNQMNNSTRSDIPITIYYAYKQSDYSIENKSGTSTGWETMLSAIIESGLMITGTWPMRTERSNRPRSIESNALATSIVLVCRKRDKNAPNCTRRVFLTELRKELRVSLKRLQESNIAPVDLAQSAIGPGIGVFSKYHQVLEADGKPMTVRSALQVINQELDLYFNEQDGEMDTESRFCVDLYSLLAFNDISFGDANTLANAKGIAVATVASHGTIYAQKGKVHLIERPELPTSINEHEGSIWLLCQQLTYKMEKDGIEGCAAAIANMYGSNAERAKDLAYRLYTIAERKKWAQEAYAYNALIVAWPEIQSRAAELKAITPQQLTLEDLLNNNN